MDIYHILCSCLCFIFLFTKAVSSFQLMSSDELPPAILGNSYSIYCQYTLNDLEEFYYIILSRKRDTVADFTKIITFRNPSSNLNMTYTNNVEGKALKSRTVATNPTASLTRATLEFTEVKCSDKAQYKWTAKYSTEEVYDFVIITNITVKARTSFPTDGSLSYDKGKDYKENDNITFTCQGDVGSEPAGRMAWYYYINSVSTDVTGEAHQNSPVLNVSACTYTRTSTLTLTLKRKFNPFIVRCTVQQDNITEKGDGHIQTKEINVKYGPSIDQISQSSQYEVGTSQVTLTCSGDANPDPAYYWVLPNNTGWQAGDTLRLENLQLNMTGVYTCVVYNEINGQNNTVNDTVNISVVKTTTTTSTTTTPPSTTVAEPNTNAVVGPDVGMSSTTIIIIVVCALVGAIIIIIAIVVFCIYKKRKEPEIEEPPEKPRNNQDLSFYSGNRPDLVSNDMKNASFNNSFDSSESKPRNDDLNYADLTFDDRPRSRRPIQLMDDSSMGSGTQYADIALPHV